MPVAFVQSLTMTKLQIAAVDKQFTAAIKSPTGTLGGNGWKQMETAREINIFFAFALSIAVLL